jgi:hypothetical protein
MPWVKLDDQFWLSDKVAEAGWAAVGFHAAALSYSGQKLTDGHLTPRDCRRIAAANTDDTDWEHLAARLVACGLWDETGDGWAIHDFLDFNPSRETVEKRREQKRDAGRQGARNRWSIAPAIAPAMPGAMSSGHAPDPTRPENPPTPQRGGRRRSKEPEPTHAPVPDFDGHNLPAQPAPPPPTLRAVP